MTTARNGKKVPYGFPSLRLTGVAVAAAICLLLSSVTLFAVGALIGTSAVQEGTGNPITTANKTSTAGSLVVGGASTWHGTTAQAPTIGSSLAGTYTAAGYNTMSVGAERIEYGIAYNIGGTRGALHNLTVSSAPTSNAAKAASWSEYSGIATTPTVTVGTESTNAGSTGPTCSVTVPSGTATVIGIFTYGGASTTATVSSGTEIAEADENSDQQNHFIAAKFGASGATTITWLLAASRQWASYCTAFQEAGGATAVPPTLILLGVGPGGHR